MRRSKNEERRRSVRVRSAEMIETEEVRESGKGTGALTIGFRVFELL